MTLLLILSEPIAFITVHCNILLCLPGRSCIAENEEWNHLTIRENSSYWSKNGILHKVTDAFISKVDPIALKINGSFLEVLREPNRGVNHHSWNTIVSIGWNSPRLKYEVFTVDVWTTTNIANCPSCKTAQTSQDKTCKALSSRPVIVNCGFLLGLQCVQSTTYEFLHFDDDRTGNWWLNPNKSTVTPHHTMYGMINVTHGRCYSEVKEE